MCSDDDVGSAIAQSFECCVDFLFGAEAGECFDLEGVVGEALAEGSGVLLAENGGRDEQGDLFSELGGLERSADGEFGFSETDITAEEPVHGLIAVHVLFYFID